MTVWGLTSDYRDAAYLTLDEDDIEYLEESYQPQKSVGHEELWQVSTFSHTWRSRY